MLHYLWSFINSINLINMLSILSLPCSVLWLSVSLLISKGLLVVSNIRCHNSNFSLSLTQSNCSWVSQIWKSNNLILVIYDLLFQINNNLFKSNCITLIDFISFLLISIQLRSYIVQKNLNLTNWTSCGQLQLQHRQHWITKWVLIDLSQNFLWALGSCHSSRCHCQD
jgi:hypothetical protein